MVSAFGLSGLELAALGIAAVVALAIGFGLSALKARNSDDGDGVEPSPDEGADGDGPTLLSAMLSLLSALVTVGALVGFVVAFVGMLFFPPPWRTYSLYVFSFGAGLLSIAGFVYLFGKSVGGAIMTPLARILFTIGTITTGGTAIDRREYGRYEAQPLRQTDEGVWQIRRDGQWVDVEDGIEYLTRLGTKPFALTYEKGDVAFKKWAANVKKEDTMALTDGGAGDYYQLDVERAGKFPQFSPRAVVEGAVGGFVIRMEAIRNSLRGAGGTGIADKSQEEAMKDFGGNTEMGTKIMLIYVVTMAALGVLAGWLVMG